MTEMALTDAVKENAAHLFTSEVSKKVRGAEVHGGASEAGALTKRGIHLEFAPATRCQTAQRIPAVADFTQ